MPHEARMHVLVGDRPSGVSAGINCLCKPCPAREAKKPVRKQLWNPRESGVESWKDAYRHCSVRVAHHGIRLGSQLACHLRVRGIRR